ncbi:THAP domain-containing protein 2 [Frankliniella fusca]|uniref:THAP domain-containing protein 2 n=1 Tax=Frankliniella fusca TaxID=407009 RepID=A0AAE1LCJ7_9NEOP|nr:THAP domain-containing protein 2 [Frankliniella fusca]KAK3913147.1 THAP domain-containing protein 2 [Frankliniella fusca]KAK3916815.1 THAP domain-containing protein 2 [Frankliniella fusca]
MVNISLCVSLLVSAMGVTRVRKGAKPSLYLPTTRPVETKASQCCSVPGCVSNRDDNLHGNLHFFPRDAVRRTYWQLVCRLLKTSRNTRICSQHFHDADFYLKGRSKILKRSARPCLQLPGRTDVTTIFDSDVLKTLLPPSCQEPNCSVTSACFTCETKLITEQRLFKENFCQQIFIINEGFQGTSPKTSSNTSLTLKMYLSSVGCPVSKTFVAQPECSVFLKLNANSQLTCLIGVSICLLESLAVASIDSSDCVKYFVHTLPLLAEVLKCAYYWPTKAEVKESMSHYFVEDFDLRLVLDCIELSFDSQYTDCMSHLQCVAQSRGMVKSLIGIAPCGLICFVSQPSVTCQISYSQIFKESELFSKNLIDPYNDAIMVRKSLDIQDVCHELAFRVLCPSSFCLKFNNIAGGTSKPSFETFIRGVQERLAMFQILKMKLFPCLTPFANDIITVIGGIVNLTSPQICEGFQGKPDQA